MRLMYIGPTIPNLIKQNTVYSNGTPNIDERLKRLIVPVNKVQEVKEKINQTGSAYNLFYKQALEVKE